MRLDLFRKGSVGVLRHFYPPTSFPEIKCKTAKEFGAGEYSVDCSLFGREEPVTFALEHNGCPFTNHCGRKPNETTNDDGPYDINVDLEHDKRSCGGL